jgi:hypothetical protein
MVAKTIDDLPARVQAAVREAIVTAMEEDGYAAESAIVECCTVRKHLRQQTRRA